MQSLPLRHDLVTLLGPSVPLLPDQDAISCSPSESSETGGHYRSMAPWHESSPLLTEGDSSHDVWKVSPDQLAPQWRPRPRYAFPPPPFFPLEGTLRRHRKAPAKREQAKRKGAQVREQKTHSSRVSLSRVRRCLQVCAPLPCHAAAPQVFVLSKDGPDVPRSSVSLSCDFV